ncbi:phage antirepressor KilAC domain-containing protein [Paraclostridium bifermentans]|uniref:phage antirepressor KilAC domain-containing protein n=1 Tax=Paraclostridium bifermentans TaxID=1490 RepID=UPI002914541E|nr:phage antirepressor KilAC domain-containing protein [Paraclostridium bifermentans]MDU3337995.1 phage antirepressor KilAC domain-containing protein [Paraclostridium bifermentans]
MEIFRNEEFGEVGVIVVDDKEYFDAIESAKILGYVNPRDAVIRHCNKEGVVFHDVGVITGKKRNGEDAIQFVNKKFIDEANLYRLIIRSKLKSARRFEKWVFETVLPTIRSHGAYMTDNVLEEVLDNPNFLNRLMEKLIDEKSKRYEAERKVGLLKESIVVNKPYVEFSKTISEVDGAISIGSFAKLLNNNNIPIGRNRLYFWFRENGYLIKKGKEKNTPKQKYIDRGLFKVIERVVQTESGNKLSVTPLITGKGQIHFLKVIEEDYILS